MRRNTKKKILVAMSGGVDSSVAAVLLVKEGYEVTGAFMKQWSKTALHPQLQLDQGETVGVCSWKQDRRDALRVAARLSIPLITVNFEHEYKEWVMDYLFREYEAGCTPNPDVLCNKYIKFGAWLDRALELGYDYLATGHYARRAEDLKSKVVSLLQAKDKEKDQTYFLHQLKQSQLEQVMFPIGDYTKKEVRAMAKKFNLPTADRAESMGICFVGEVPMKEFLSQRITPRPGRIVTSAGRVIGTHDGLAFYTIGQRHGWVDTERVKSLNNKPMYVVGKRVETNELVVGYENDPLLFKKTVRVGAVNWIRQAPDFPLTCEVRLRHRQTMQKAEVKMQNGEIVIDFADPQRAVTPGQFAVFYFNRECLGGGVITSKQDLGYDH